jgi:divalent metal cation (Fe/Co/Zn/Cd) transporter
LLSVQGTELEVSRRPIPTMLKWVLTAKPRKALIMSIAGQNEMIRDRTVMIQQAFWLEYLTLAWMTVEAAVAIASGIAANSLTLVAFGIDSVIELASAGILVWRLTVELRRGQMFAESAEQKALRIGGGLLSVLAAYVVASAGWKLWTHQGAEFSLPGLIVCVLALPIMYFLSRRKLALAAALGSRALRADAVESITCGWLSLFVVAALIAQLAIGAWWLDAVASLGIVWFLVREGREAWSGEECCTHHH